jgi:hypothetical protein
MCFKPNFEGHYFRKFVLPETRMERQLVGEEIVDVEAEVENSSAAASWYFLNVLNIVACIEGVMSWEDYSNIEDEPTREEKWARAERVAKGGNYLDKEV